PQPPVDSVSATTKPPVSVPPGILQLPDLHVLNVSCEIRGGDIWLSAHIKNENDTPVRPPESPPVTVDVLATLNPGQGQNERRLPLQAIVPPAPHASNPPYFIAVIPDADPQNLAPVLFKIYVNPQTPDAPYAIFESDYQNNWACGICQCDSNGCTPSSSPQCTIGP